MRQKRTSQGYPIFPRTIEEFQRRFATERACRDYLMKVRWPDGFDCPRCGHRSAWEMDLRRLRCRGCHADVRITAGTILHDSHLPFRHWFWAAYLMSTMSAGISALQLYRHLGIGSYRTALSLCRRLRKAMVNPAREPLTGVVEVDETYVGGAQVRKGMLGRKIGDKVPVVVAVENRGDHAGRIRLRAIADVSSDSLHPFICENIARGTQLNTDDWKGYSGIDGYGYKHRPKVQGTEERAGKILPWVHRIIGNLKTWLRGTHHGVEPKYMQGYLDEFTFRHNRRHIREHAFLSLLILSTRLKHSKPVPALQGASSA